MRIGLLRGVELYKDIQSATATKPVDESDFVFDENMTEEKFIDLCDRLCKEHFIAFDDRHRFLVEFFERVQCGTNKDRALAPG